VRRSCESGIRGTAKGERSGATLPPPWNARQQLLARRGHRTTCCQFAHIPHDGVTRLRHGYASEQLVLCVRVRELVGRLRDLLREGGSLAGQLSVVGSIIAFTSVMVEAGNPEILACSRIASSSSAR
jgi:hypothetical protein